MTKTLRFRCRPRNLPPMRALLLLLLLCGCATRPAEVRVTFDPVKITSGRASGYADRATRRRVTGDDPVRIASVSKLVVALGVVRMVEAGQLDLDRDVSDYLGWRLRNPAFPDSPITLRLLLSHRSSLTDGVDYAIPLGGMVRETVADPKAWEAKAPGSWFHYTNLNFPVVASVMERVGRERFDRLMQRLVFEPLKLDACFNWTTCSDATVARAVVLYGDKGEVRRDGLRGKRPDCPVLVVEGPCDLSAYKPGDNGALFSPQGGLRISANGLARIGRMLLRGGEDFLKSETLALLVGGAPGQHALTGEREGGFFCAYSLAGHSIPNRDQSCRDDLFGDGRVWYGHAGEAYGLRSGLWISGDRGVAFFATGVPDDATGKGRHSAFTPQEERLARGK